MAGEIFVVTSSGAGHLLPSIELCYHTSSRNYKTTLILPSSLSSSLPSSFLNNPLLEFAEITPVPFFLSPDSGPACEQAALELEAHISKAISSSNTCGPLCAVIDFPMAGAKYVFWKFNVPIISFFSFGACAAAMEHGAWKAEVNSMNPGETRRISGLPEEMAVSHCEIQRPPGAGGPKLGHMPPWAPAIEGSIGLMFNTCEDLERPFIEYLSKEIAVPIWGVGPLLPERYWTAVLSDSPINDNQSSISNEELVGWLDSKPRGSVLYVSFGTTVGPTVEEKRVLGCALKESDHPFIWAMAGSDHGLDQDVNRGLIISGWAPQLSVLSHPSTGGFLSHCGWNSTVEAIGLGVPILGWPIRGDQHLSAKLVVSHLRTGHMARKRGPGEMVRKEEIMEGIEKLLRDEEVKRRAKEIRFRMFGSGFPRSSKAAFDGFRDFMSTQRKFKRVELRK